MFLAAGVRNRPGNAYPLLGRVALFVLENTVQRRRRGVNSDAIVTNVHTIQYTIRWTNICFITFSSYAAQTWAHKDSRDKRARAHTHLTLILCVRTEFSGKTEGAGGRRIRWCARTCVCVCTLTPRCRYVLSEPTTWHARLRADPERALLRRFFFFFYYSLPPVPPPPPPYPLVTHRTVHRFFRSAPDPSPEFTLYPPRHYATLVCVCVCDSRPPSSTPERVNAFSLVHATVIITGSVVTC